MMNYIWAGMMLISIIFAMATGRIPDVTSAAFAGASDAITLVISLLGIMCLWTGLMKIAQESGLTRIAGRALSPLTRFLFPNIPTDSPTMEAITMNMTANLLGMANAATPLGLAAMRELKKDCSNSGIASHDMCMFVVINTASLQLVPATIIAMRQSAGSLNPSWVIVPVWICSVCALTVSAISAKFFRYIGNSAHSLSRDSKKNPSSQRFFLRR